jgi:hypothetical protein
MTMTRAEGICACENIIALVDTLQDHLNENSRAKFESYGESLKEKARSMQERMESSPQYEHVTEAMDNSLRNIWGGLRRWDRKDEFNADLFDDLSQVVARLKKSDAEEGVVTSAPEEDLESDEMLDDEQKALLEKLANARSYAGVPAPQAMADAAARSALGHAEDAAKLAKEIIEKFSPETFSKAKNAAIATVLEQFAEQHIKIVDHHAINSGVLTYLIGKTSSIRTQELLYSGWYAGKIAGIRILYDTLKELLNV